MIATAATAGVIGAAFCAGAVDAMVGGGGLLQLPALFGAFPGAAPATLLGTSKLAGAMGTGTAAWRYGRRVSLPWRLLAPGCALALAGGLAGATLATRAPVALFRPLVPVLLTLVWVATLSMRGFGAVHDPRYARHTLLAGAAWILVIGVYDGFFGPGTGSFLMFMLVRTQAFDFLHASAAARVLNLSTNAAALAWFGARGHVLPALGLTMGAANMAGSLLGTRLALRGGARFVRRVFLVVVAALIIKTARDAWLELAPG